MPPTTNNLQGITLADKSYTLTTTSVAALPANEGRLALIIQNVSTHSAGVNLAGGTASIGGTGTLTLHANDQALMFLGPAVPLNAITAIGTANDVIVILEGSNATISGVL